jgi:hypothetical protein
MEAFPLAFRVEAGRGEMAPGSLLTVLALLVILSVVQSAEAEPGRDPWLARTTSCDRPTRSAQVFFVGVHIWLHRIRQERGASLMN